MTGAGRAAPNPAPPRALSAVILAAGEGTRMRSPLPKVLHAVSGLPMVLRVVRLARAAGAERPVVVVGFGRERVVEALAGERVAFAVQEEQLGTGHAVRCAEPALGGGDRDVLILSGDVPLIRAATLDAFIADHRREERAATVMTAILADPGMLGRVVRDRAGGLARIVEVRDATAEERALREINGGIYCFSLADLRAALPLVDRDNAQRQYYLTDTVEILRRQGRPVGAWTAADAREILGVNTPEELAMADRIMRERGDGCA